MMIETTKEIRAKIVTNRWPCENHVETLERLLGLRWKTASIIQASHPFEGNVGWVVIDHNHQPFNPEKFMLKKRFEAMMDNINGLDPDVKAAFIASMMTS